MKTKFEIIGIVLLFALMTGCTNLELRSSETIRQEQAAQYQAQAAEYEDKGDLVEALKQYRLVLTVDPDNQIARDKSIQIEQELVRLADEHYQSGMSHYREGRYKLARQEFLAALRYDMDHRQIKKMLRKQRELKQINKYVLHTMQSNESISILAQRYYGDYRKFHLIALYNQLEDAAKVKVGRKIKVPVIEGFPIMADPSEIQTDAGKVSLTEPVEIIAVKRFIIHTVVAKETLSTIAQRYYGDFRKYDLIAKFNDISVTDSIGVGQELKIPQVEGVPFLATDSGKKIEKSLESEIIPEAEKNLQEAAVEPAKDVDETTEAGQADAYRKIGIKLFNKEKYGDAIIEFQKVLNTNPDDKIAKNYMSLAYFEIGYISFNNADYPQAIKDFERSLQSDSNCKRCDTYIKWSEDNYKDLHYRKGLAYFREEKLAEAIDEWEMVYKVDPNYKDVEKNIEKVRNLMNRL
jgi:tetratricopeptide (TPR) repeat protein